LLACTTCTTTNFGPNRPNKTGLLTRDAVLVVVKFKLFMKVGRAALGSSQSRTNFSNFSLERVSSIPVNLGSVHT
jgi:hypothetical protein